MKKILKIDINAHIKNLICTVNSVGQNNVASISFDNLGFGTITAIKFKAVAYDSFNKILKINDNNIFLLTIDNISIYANQFSEVLKIPVPLEVKKLELKEEEICYFDGATVAYESADIREFDIEYFDFDNDENKLKIKLLKEKYENKVDYICKAKEFECGWICSCGRYNRPEFEICSNCGVSKTEILEISSDKELEKILLVDRANKSFKKSRTIKDYKRTINMLKKIPEYENSENMIRKCKRKIKILKKIAIISPITVTTIIGVILLWSNVISPKMRYSNAVNLINNGQYNEAITAFKDIGIYRDSEEQVDKIKYQAIKSAKVGDIVSYGKYPNNIFWKVMLKSGNIFALMNVEPIANMKFISLSKDKGAFLYDEMDEETFLNTIFSEEEGKRVTEGIGLLSNTYYKKWEKENFLPENFMGFISEFNKSSSDYPGYCITSTKEKVSVKEDFSYPACILIKVDISSL